ncbi:MAG TPA: glycerol-3-phosphate dehydrogenase/oxidase [Candidatus Nanopelagicales bacterium]|nr:glycerol-3-phosphate dehydrogenase/oxidase [Candidatus Nanopelagicales bacterium]
MDPTSPGALGPGYRDRAWARLAAGVDVLVVGGGVTGAGVALDAAVRGLSVGLVEQRDFAAGTSSRSSKLVHGGLRYLEQLNLGLVREALRERTLLLETLAPHLVRPLPFLLPLRHRVWERPYVGAGLTLYDTLGGLSPALPRHSHLSKAATLKACPSLRPDNLAGSIRYHDAQVDDARHTVELVRTAAAHGAVVVSAARVASIPRDGERVVGARVHDAETGREHDVPARVVVNATGVWSGRVEALAGVEAPVRMRPSKGVHLIVPQERIDSSTALISRTKSSVLFVLPWGATWIIGTTDTPWRHGYSHPAPTQQDVGYLLAETNKVLSSDLAESDVTGLYAGLRPLLDHEGTAESELSREHVVRRPVAGLVTVTGGKYTTYRVMAADAVDATAADLGELPATTTASVPLLGAARPAEVVAATAGHPGAALVGEADRTRLAARYGALLPELLDLVAADPALARPLGGGSGHLGVEVVYATAYEGALHIDDVLTRRTRIYLEAGDRGLAAAGRVALLMAGVLGWDDATRAGEVVRYQRRLTAELQAQQAPDDDAAAATRDRVRDPRLP